VGNYCPCGCSTNLVKDFDNGNVDGGQTTYNWVRSQASMQSLQNRCMHAEIALVFFISPMQIEQRQCWRIVSRDRVTCPLSMFISGRGAGPGFSDTRSAVNAGSSTRVWPGSKRAAVYPFLFAKPHVLFGFKQGQFERLPGTFRVSLSD
jgi:hypothetical protein